MIVMSSRSRTPLGIAVLPVLVSALLTGCAGERPQTSDGSTAPITVVTSFYPLEYLAERVGGERVQVTNLAGAGVEPHDLELTPKDVALIDEADQVVYLKGFQPAVDDAVAAQAADSSWDVASAADLSLTFTPVGEGAQVGGEANATDPHFWLDPARYAAVAQALAVQLRTISPQDSAAFTRNADELGKELRALDHEWADATETCANRDLVTSHNAFGYLAERYGFVQRGITGLSPEQEPSPQTLAATADFVAANGVTTIYYETLVSPAIADTVANETGAATAVLDPLEGLSEESAGDDYFAVMRANLASVISGQGCS